jgi:hypothetical protein
MMTRETGKPLSGTLCMTRLPPFTQAQVKRAIAAAKKAGLRIIGIRPDGTIIVHDGK